MLPSAGAQGAGALSGAELLTLLRDRYEQLSAREKSVFDIIISVIMRHLSADEGPAKACAERMMQFVRSGSRELEHYIQYGQALLAVYRLVKRGIVPDPKIIDYLKDNLDPALAKSLALSQTPSPTSSLAASSSALWSRASLAQKILRDSNNKYSRLVNTAGGAGPGAAVPAGGGEAASGGMTQQINFAVRLENLRVLQNILAKKFLKHSLRSPEQIYNFIVSNDAVATLSAIAGAVLPDGDARLTAYSGGLDRKEDVLVKLAALMSEPGARIAKNGALQTTNGGFVETSRGTGRVPEYLALSHFRKHRFPAGRLRLAKTICLKDDVTDLGRQWLDHRLAKRHAFAAIAKQASTRISSRELKRQQELEREQRERMKALRERNMDAYMALVKNVKNQRIQEILENTEKLLQDIGAKIQVERVQNEERRRQEAQRAADKVRRREERKLARKQSQMSASAAAPNPEEVAEEAAQEVEAVSFAQRASELVEQPSCLIGGKLMPYQLAGLDFLVSLYTNNLSGILADEMGLGKTIQTISLIAYLLEVKANPGPHLIAVPLSTLPNWSSEFAKWCPSLKVLQYRGNKVDRRELNYEVKRCRYNVLLTTFEYILRERSVLGAVKWRFIIVDEGHKMKNVKSKFHTTLGEFKSTHRLLLTGTPLQNNLNELWSLLNFLMPHTFSSGEDFERWFEEPFREQFGTPTAAPSNALTAAPIALTEEEKLIVINRLHLVLRPFLLRRVKADVLSDLPSKREYVIRVPLSSWQKLLYRQILNKSLKVKDSASGRITQKSISNTIMQLRKAVNHPYLFLDMYNVDHNLYRASGKFELLDRILSKLLKFNHKILIFSQMTSLMDILADYFEFKQLRYYRLDGSIMLSERQDIMARFNGTYVDETGGAVDDEQVNIFMLSTRAGGLGLNLQSGDTVILFDSDWNPHADLQAQARVHRVGQKREVLVLRFITDSPVEEMILAKAQYKLSIDQQIIQAGMFSNQFDENEREQNLRQLLSQKDIQGSTSLTTPPELVKYLARSLQEAEAFAEMDRELFGTEIYDLWPIAGGPGDSATAANDSETGLSTDPSAAIPTAKTIAAAEDSSLVSQIQKEQVKRDNDKVCELLELSGRLCREEDIPPDVKEINPSEPEPEGVLLDDDTRTVRKSRLRAQQLFNFKEEQDPFDDPEELEDPVGESFADDPSSNGGDEDAGAEEERETEEAPETSSDALPLPDDDNATPSRLRTSPARKKTEAESPVAPPPSEPRPRKISGSQPSATAAGKRRGESGGGRSVKKRKIE